MNIFWNTVENELGKINSSITELSRAVSLSRNTIFSWRNNNRIPPADKAMQIAEYLNVDLKYLLTGENRGLSKEQSRWKFWIDNSTDEELENSRFILTASKEFYNLIDKKLYTIPGSNGRKTQAADNSHDPYKGKKSKPDTN